MPPLLVKCLNPFYLYAKRDQVRPYWQRYRHDLQRALEAARGRAYTGLAGAGLVPDADDRALARLKDIHRGRRAFVLGNGPSLRASDLARLKNEITFGCNRIYLMFEQTSWRPTYFTVEDVLAFGDDYAEYAKMEGVKKFFPKGIKGKRPHLPGTLYIDVRSRSLPDKEPPFSRWAPACLYSGYTVVYLNLQLAVHMGIRELYLLGVDCNYSYQQDQPQARQDVATQRPERYDDYFHPGYRKKDEMFFNPGAVAHFNAYRSAARALAACGGRLCNATRGGKLELLPRVDFDQLVP